MEYPTLFTAGARWLAPPRVAVPERVTIHEAGHQWWYGMVGSNEFEHAWMDEGLNTYSEARTMEAAAFPNHLGLRFFGGFVPWVIDDIRMVARDRRQPPDRLSRQRGSRRPVDADLRYWPSTATFITYNKTALWLHTLERRSRVAAAAAGHVHLLRTLEVPASAAGRFLRRRERSHRPRT